jgi:hypothetical protein
MPVSMLGLTHNRSVARAVADQSQARLGSSGRDTATAGGGVAGRRRRKPRDLSLLPPLNSSFSQTQPLPVTSAGRLTTNEAKRNGGQNTNNNNHRQYGSWYMPATRWGDSARSPAVPSDFPDLDDEHDHGIVYIIHFNHVSTTSANVDIMLS